MGSEMCIRDSTQGDEMIAMKNFDTSRSEADMLLDTDSDTDTDSDNQVTNIGVGPGGEQPRKNNKRMESGISKKKNAQRQEQTLYDWMSKSPASSSAVQSPMRGGVGGEDRQETNLKDAAVVANDEDGVMKEEASGPSNSM